MLAYIQKRKEQFAIAITTGGSFTIYIYVLAALVSWNNSWIIPDPRKSLQSKQVFLSVPLFCFFAMCGGFVGQNISYLKVIEGTLPNDLGDISSILRMLVVCLPLKGLPDTGSAIVLTNLHFNLDLKLKVTWRFMLPAAF